MSGFLTKKRKTDDQKPGKKGMVSAEYIELRDAIVANDIAALTSALDKCGPDGGDLDAVDGDLRTLLGWSIKSDFLRGMELLLTKGAKPDSRTTLFREGKGIDLETPLTLVSGSPSCDIKFYSFKTEQIMKNKLEMAECLIRFGINCVGG